MVKYSTISLPKELYEILQKLLENKPEWGYNSVADFCKEAIRLHLMDVKRQVREDFWRKLDVQELFKKIEMVAECDGNLYQRAFKSIKDMAFLLSRDFHLKDVNEAFSYLLNYGRTEIFKKHISNFIERWDEIEKELKANGYIRDFETKIVRKDGKKLDILVTINKLKDNYFGVAKDITIRKAVEEKNRKEKEIYKKIIDNLYSGVIVIQNGKIKFVNKAVTPSGYTPEELIGRRIDDFIVEKEKLQREMEKVLTGKKKNKATYYTIMGKDGKLRRAEVYSTRIDYEGKPAILTCFRIQETK